jgi:membrane-associated phospholipid phosphatase
MYLNQHWASDVAAGTVLGAVIGRKVVGYAHSHTPSTLDRWLLDVSAAPTGRGELLVTISVRY